MFQLFAGFLIRRTAIPRGWIWMHYLSLFKYPVFFLVSTELSGETFNCDNNAGAVSLPYDATVNVANMIADGANKIYCSGMNGMNATWPCYACPIINGNDMIQEFDMPTAVNDRALMLGCVAIFMVAYRVFAYLSLRYVNHITK
jgi:ABC-type multidrug transport system permease subunit